MSIDNEKPLTLQEKITILDTEASKKGREAYPRLAKMFDTARLNREPNIDQLKEEVLAYLWYKDFSVPVSFNDSTVKKILPSRLRGTVPDLEELKRNPLAFGADAILSLVKVIEELISIIEEPAENSENK